MKRISCVSVKEIQWILDFWRPLFCTDNPKWYIQSSAMKLQQKDRPLKPKWETESSHATGTIPQFSPWREERMKRRMEEYERTQLLVVWTEERGRKKRGEKKAWFSTTYLSASSFYWTESEDWAHHWLSLSSLLFWRPCNSQLPLQLAWLFFSPVFYAFATACSQNPSLCLTDTYATRE